VVTKAFWGNFMGKTPTGGAKNASLLWLRGSYLAGTSTGAPVNLKRTFTSGDTLKRKALRMTFRFQFR
jgi:hypothetical protein